METFLIKAAQLILAFALLVIIHEFGHFLFARIFGIKVEKFYIFFNPWFELAKWKPKKYLHIFGKKIKSSPDNDADEKNGFWNNTEYGVGWLPLGGYCKIAGMIDESLDTAHINSEPQEWEFRSKPAWQRLLVMVAGVLFNFILAILIYAGIVYAMGEKYVPFDKASLGMSFSDEAKKIGFRDGDIPVSADGELLDNPGEARIKILQAKNVSVLRDGTYPVDIAIPSDFIFRIEKETKEGNSPVNLMAYRIPVKVTQIQPGEGASKAGIAKGDVIIAIDSVATPDLLTFFNTLPGHDNATVDLTIARKNGNRTDTLTLPVQLSANSKMGIGLEVDPAAFFETKEIRYNLFESIPRGIELGVDKLSSYASSMKLVFTSEGAKSLGGFGTLGSIFPESWDWMAFWNITAFLSVALAFMNILPIPALDGGHVLFLLYEVITRRKPSDKFMEWAQMAGMGLLFLLLIYANGMDIVRLFK